MAKAEQVTLVDQEVLRQDLKTFRRLIKAPQPSIKDRVLVHVGGASADTVHGFDRIEHLDQALDDILAGLKSKHRKKS